MSALVMESLHLIKLNPTTLGADGLFRLSVKAFCCLPVEHASSGLKILSSHENMPAYGGYSEWRYHNGNSLSLAWDWQWLWQDGRMQMQISSSPRSNFQLQCDAVDLSPRHNEILIIQFIEQYLDWRNVAKLAVQQANS